MTRALLAALRPTTALRGPVSLSALDPVPRATMIAWCLLCLAAASLTVQAVLATELP